MTRLWRDYWTAYVDFARMAGRWFPPAWWVVSFWLSCRDLRRDMSQSGTAGYARRLP